MEYWNWWIGAIALGAFVILYGLLIGKPLGVSGSWMRIVNWRSDKELKAANDFFQENQDEAIDDLMAATLAEFGDSAVEDMPDPVTDKATTAEAKNATSRYTPAGAHFVFLITMMLGSFIATQMNGSFEFKYELSALHTNLSGQPWEMWFGLLCGGILVGFGTQMAGGCTSGHGLSGCSQFIPASLFATLVFFLSAVAMSMLMKFTS